MSGLEPIAALGLACNIMQVISLAHEIAGACTNVLQTGTPDPSLVKSVAGSVGVFRKLEAELESIPGNPSDDEQQLLDLARDSLSAGLELKTEIEKVSREPAKGKFGASLKIAVTAKLKARKIAKLEKTMQDYQRVLEARLLTRIWYGL